MLLAMALAALGCPSACPAPRDPPGAPRAALEPVVSRDAAFAPAGAVPDELVSALSGARVILLGETHYVEEHQQLVPALLARLHAAGFRWILEEGMHATAWTGEEYVMLRSDQLPPHLSRFDQALLDGLRAVNQGLAEADRIHFGGFDMNHFADAFQTGARELRDRFGAVAALDDVLAAPAASAAYAQALQALPARLEADRAAIEQAIGPARHAQLLDLTAVELRSLPLRSRMDPTVREGIIRDNVAAVLSAAAGAGVAVNCGMNHAQKETHMGPTAEVVGSWLFGNAQLYGGDPGKLRSVAFAGARGRRLSTYQGAPWTYDLVVQGAPNSLTRILAEQAGDRLAWLPLADPVFSGEVLFDIGGDARVLPVGRLYDGVVLYPSVSVLHSLLPP